MSRYELSKDEINTATGFVAMNSRSDDADFTIVLGQHRWKIRADVLCSVSPYFNVLCNGSFQEAKTREVHLKDDNVCDFARLLQFVLTKEYDREPGDSNACKYVKLNVMVSEKELSQEGWGSEGAREKSEIDKAMWMLADKYDVESLRNSVVTHMVFNLPSSRCKWYDGEKPDFARFQVEFVEVFNFIQRDLHKMPKINEYLVDELFNVWTQQYDGGSRTIPSLLDIGNSTAPADQGLQDFQRQLKGFVKKNESFATEMMMGFQRVANKGFENFKWSATRINDLGQHRYRQVGPDGLIPYIP